MSVCTSVRTLISCSLLPVFRWRLHFHLGSDGVAPLAGMYPHSVWPFFFSFSPFSHSITKKHNARLYGLSVKHACTLKKNTHSHTEQVRANGHGRTVTCLLNAFFSHGNNKPTINIPRRNRHDAFRARTPAPKHTPRARTHTCASHLIDGFCAALQLGSDEGCGGGRGAAEGRGGGPSNEMNMY